MSQQEAVARALRSYYRNEIAYTELLQQLPLRATHSLIAEIAGYGKPANARMPSFTMNEDWLDKHIKRIFDIINLLDPPPAIIGNNEVVLYSEIDRRHIIKRESVYTRGTLVRRICGVAICVNEDSSYYLFGCDENWNTITDTLHDSIEDAKEQAERDFENVSSTWRTIRTDRQ